MIYLKVEGSKVILQSFWKDEISSNLVYFLADPEFGLGGGGRAEKISKILPMWYSGVVQDPP